MSGKTGWSWLCASGMGVAASAIASAAPVELTWQARLVDPGGAPFDGPVELDLRLFGVPTGGVALWSDQASVVADQGFVSVVLGSAGDLELGHLAGEAWIEVAVDGQTLAPRNKLSSVPHAHIASAVRLEGAASSATCVGQGGALVFDTSLHSLRVCDGAVWTTIQPADDTPDAFDFADVIHVEPGAVVTSSAVTLSGFDLPLSATVTGDGSPRLLVDGLEVGASATVEEGDQLQVRLTAASALLTPRTATVRVGRASDTFTATTRPECAPGTFTRTAFGTYTLEVDAARSNCRFDFVLKGAGGGPSRFGAGPGGAGGRVSFSYRPTGTGTLTITVGEPGVANNGGAPHGGGGAAGDRGGSGGGATYVSFNGTLLAAAGGGGGGGGNFTGAAGAAGGATGSSGQSCSGGGGGGGGQNSGGASGGAGGAAGSYLQGGNGGGGCCGGGGGGGGGYYGGGAGGGNPSSSFTSYCGGAGGGGSSYLHPTVTNVANVAGGGGSGGVGSGNGNGGETGGVGSAEISWVIP